MATTELTEDLLVPRAEVEGSSSTSSWSVAECGWKQILPDLPDDVIALLATPVVVTAEALVGAATKPLRPAEAARPVIEACTPQFLAPAPPKRARLRQRLA